MKRSSFLEDLFEIAAKLRWYYALIIALGCYLLFSYLASSPVVYNPKTGAAGIGSFAGKQLLTVVSGLLRYIVPAIFCLGALVAFFKQRKRNSLYENVLGQNASVHIDAGYKLSSMTWEDFEYHFLQIHESFYKNLEQRHPSLTNYDKRLAAMLKLRLSTKEISNLLNVFFAKRKL